MKIIGAERPLFLVNSDGYMVPCQAMVKIVPNLYEGM